MKFIFCSRCEDLFRLHDHDRECKCGVVYGQHIDETKLAVVSKDSMIVELDDDSFKKAQSVWAKDGEEVHFDAFIEKKGCKLTIRLEPKHQRKEEGNRLV